MAIVEDDTGMREALLRRLTAAGLVVRGYESAEHFLESGPVSDVRCLVLDVRLPGISGLDLQRRLVQIGNPRPVIFISAHDTAAGRRQAGELGAVAFLIKPFEGQLLLDALKDAFAQSPN